MTNKFYWEDRHEPERKETMVGATLSRKKCKACHQYKSSAGSKIVFISNRIRFFYCAECVEKGAHKKCTE